MKHTVLFQLRGAEDRRLKFLGISLEPILLKVQDFFDGGDLFVPYYKKARFK